MFDKKNYIKNKIINRLNTSKYYQSSSQKEQINNLMNSLPHLDMIAYSGSTFEDSTIGWLSFCKTIDSMLELNKEINLENFRELFETLSTKNELKRSSIVEYDYSTIEENSYDKLKRLSEIAEENDLAEDIEYDFLTDEGLKVIGAIDRDETTLNAEEISIKKEKLLPVVKVNYDELENNTIISPYTGTNQVSQVTSDIWMDIDTEELFRVKVIKNEE